VSIGLAVALVGLTMLALAVLLVPLLLRRQRLAAMLEAVRTVRPAMDAYYNSLSDEQKARLTLAQPHMGRGGMGERWRERMNRWRERTERGEPRDRMQNEQQPGESDRL